MNADTFQGRWQQLKGKIREKWGDLTDDEDLKREGKVDQAAGSIKEKISDAADKVKDAVTGKDRK